MQKVSEMTIEEVEDLLQLDSSARVIKQDKFVHVFYDSEYVVQEELEAKVASFDPLNFFDPKCAHCQPFIDDGAIMHWDANDLIGMRLLGNGQFETVMLTNPSPSQTRAGAVN